MNLKQALIIAQDYWVSASIPTVADVKDALHCLSEEVLAQEIKLDDLENEKSLIVDAFKRHVELTHAGLHHEAKHWRVCNKLTCYKARLDLIVEPISQSELDAIADSKEAK